MWIDKPHPHRKTASTKHRLSLFHDSAVPPQKRTTEGTATHTMETVVADNGMTESSLQPHHTTTEELKRCTAIWDGGQLDLCLEGSRRFYSLIVSKLDQYEKASGLQEKKKIVQGILSEWKKEGEILDYPSSTTWYDKLQNQLDADSTFPPPECVRMDPITETRTVNQLILRLLQRRSSKKETIAEPKTVTNPNFGMTLEDLDTLLTDRLPAEHSGNSLDANPELTPARAKARAMTRAVFGFHRHLLQHEDYIGTHEIVPALSPEKMEALAQQLFLKQTEFELAGKNSELSLGFHFTSLENVESIRERGLLTNQDLEMEGIDYAFHGNAFGPGIYTTAVYHPHILHRFGPVGYLVLSLEGSVVPSVRRSAQVDSDSVQGLTHILMLKSSAQCLPVVEFDSSDPLMPHWLGVSTNAWPFPSKEGPHWSSTIKELATLFSGGNWKREQDIVFPSSRRPSSRTLVTAPKPLSGFSRLFTLNPVRLGRIQYRMPDCIFPSAKLSKEAYQLEKPCRHDEHETPECSICLLEMTKPKIARLHCGHKLHLACLEEWSRRKAECPVCRHPFGGRTQRGHQPTGTMTVSVNPLLVCAGHPPGTLEIVYSFSSGRQKQYHPNPGATYSGTERKAYVPDTMEGRALVSRLQDAFRHGLVFTVGTSLTSGVSNVITWASIPHKTKTCDPAHGFPDPLYIENCNAALTAHHVKPAGPGRSLW